jgi:hyaluronan synthase
MARLDEAARSRRDHARMPTRTAAAQLEEPSVSSPRSPRTDALPEGADDTLEELPEGALARLAVSESAQTLDDEDVLRLRELRAHGSHKRRIRRRAGAAPAPIAEDQPLSRGAVVARATLAVAVTAVFVAVVGASGLEVLGGTLLAGSTSARAAVVALLTLFGLGATAHFVATCVRAWRYRPVGLPGDAALPRVTVIVPAYNEGAMVRVALESALASDYPRERLEILAIDDGSEDDTWEHIQAVAEAHPDVVVAIRQPKNAGKREALRTGFLRATGELVVTVDSDSKLERSALRAIVAPMIQDDEVAAVAGRVLVLNREDHLYAKLLSARFFLTFDLARASQSRSGAVLCTPGALSAYRRDAVMRVLEAWSSQTFLGQPCTIAEDRALTTWLLRDGHRSVYQRSAVVRTMMPTTLRQIARMLVRWERGNIREDLVMLPLLATRWRRRDQLWPTLEILIELVQYPVAWVGLALVAASVLAQPAALLGVGAAVLLSAVVQSLWILRSRDGSDFVYGVAYALFAFVGLQWVFPYSLLTVRDGRWMTR